MAAARGLYDGERATLSDDMLRPLIRVDDTCLNTPSVLDAALPAPSLFTGHAAYVAGAREPAIMTSDITLATAAPIDDSTAEIMRPPIHNPASSQTLVLTDHDLTVNADQTISYTNATDGGSAIYVDPDNAHVNSGLSIINHGQIIASTTLDNGGVGAIFYEENSFYRGAVLENDGLIQVTATANALEAAGITSDGFMPEFDNTANGRLIVSGDTAVGFSAFGPPLAMDGTISSVFTNDGLIQVSTTAGSQNSAVGVSLQGRPWYLENTGTITVHADTAADPSGFARGATAIIFDAYGEVDNYGHITATADHNSQWAAGILNPGLVVNYGDISAPVAIYEQENASAGPVIVENYGSIEGSTTLLDSDDVAVNSGTIVGDITLNGGNDIFDGRGGTTTGLVSGDDGNDTFYGGSGHDNFSGGAGDDVFTGGGGNDTIDGGNGNDTAIFAGPQSAYTVTHNGATTTVAGPDGTDTLTNVENLKFDDSPPVFSGHMTINVIWDSSVDSAPAAFKTVVNQVVQLYESTFSDPVTINISVGYGEIDGQPLDPGALGESEVAIAAVGYSFLIGALKQDARSAADMSSIANLSDNPPSQSYFYAMPRAEALALNVPASYSSLDGAIGFDSSGAFDYDRSNGISANKYDFYAAVAHEISEVMGRQLAAGDTSIQGTEPGYFPLDLFHYSGSGVLDVSGTQAGYFSIDGGATNLNSFNTDSSGDFGDWADSAGNDAFDAFANPGVVNAVTPADITALDVIGWDSANGHAPTVQGHYLTEPAGTSIPLTELFSIADPDGAADIATFAVSTDTMADVNGYLTHNGTQFPIGLQPAVEPYSDIGNWDFVTGQTGSDVITLKVTDAEGNTSSRVLATATVGVNQTFTGTSSNDTYVGGHGDDVFYLGQGGNDTASGQAGNDSFYMDAQLGRLDSIDGGAGDDTVYLSGNYAGSSKLTFLRSTIQNIETLSLGTGHSYDLTMDANSVFTGRTLTVEASALGAADRLTLNASAETNAGYVVNGGAGNDVISTGGGGDTIRPGGGIDTVSSGAGNDTIDMSSNAGRLTAGDSIDGGADSDTVSISGDYTGANKLVFARATLQNVETLRIGAGHSYDLTMDSNNVFTGRSLTVDGSSLGAPNRLTLNAGAETNASYDVNGGAGNDTIVTGGGNDVIAPGRGADKVVGGGGNDTFSFGANLTSADSIDGGTGNDTVYLSGDYTGANKLVFARATLQNVETLHFGAGHSYDLTMDANNVFTGSSLTADGSDLGASDSLTLDAHTETTASYIATGGAGADVFHMGAGADTVTGGGGGDTIDGGSGHDIFVYRSAADSTSIHFDTLDHLNYGQDRFNIPGSINAIDPAVKSGTLSTASFDSNLASALSGHLHSHDAVLFTASGGTLAGQTFLVVDLNGAAGYQAGADLVFHVMDTLGTLATTDFI